MTIIWILLALYGVAFFCANLAPEQQSVNTTAMDRLFRYPLEWAFSQIWLSLTVLLLFCVVWLWWSLSHAV